MWLCINCYLLTSFYLDLQKITKGKFNTNSIVALFFISVWINCYLFHVFIHAFIKFYVWIYVVCFSIWDDYMTWFYYFTISRKEVPRKFWLDSRFPRNPKLKWILKWLPLYRSYFKVYFFKRGKFFNNLVPYMSLNS